MESVALELKNSGVRILRVVMCVVVGCGSVFLKSIYPFANSIWLTFGTVTAKFCSAQGRTGFNLIFS